MYLVDLDEVGDGDACIVVCSNSWDELVGNVCRAGGLCAGDDGGLEARCVGLELDGGKNETHDSARVERGKKCTRWLIAIGSSLG